MDIEYGSSQEEKKNERIFNQLIEQYNAMILSLPSEEREKMENSLLIYNSCLYEAINQLVAIPNFRDKTPKELYEELSKNPDFAKTTRIFIRSLMIGNKAIEKGDKTINADIYKKLSIVKCSSVKEYIESLISIYDTIMKYQDSLKLQEDIYLYRGIGKKDENIQSDMSRSEIISTSLDRNIAKKFFRESKTPTFFMMKVKEGTSFMVIPYRLISKVVSYKEGRELVIYQEINHNHNLGDKEVVLFNSKISLENSNTSIVDDGFKRITVIETDVKSKDKEELQRDTQTPEMEI